MKRILLLLSVALFLFSCGSPEGEWGIYHPESAEKTAQGFSEFVGGSSTVQSEPEMRGDKIYDVYHISDQIVVMAEEDGGTYQVLASDISVDLAKRILDAIKFPEIEELNDIIEHPINGLYTEYKGLCLVVLKNNRISDSSEEPIGHFLLTTDSTRFENLKEMVDKENGRK